MEYKDIKELSGVFGAASGIIFGAVIATPYLIRYLGLEAPQDGGFGIYLLSALGGGVAGGFIGNAAADLFVSRTPTTKDQRTKEIIPAATRHARAMMQGELQ